MWHFPRLETPLQGSEIQSKKAMEFISSPLFFTSSMIHPKKLLRTVGVLLACASPSPAADALAESFMSPPANSRPETWFHLIGGNVSKPGLTADLEAIAAAGLSGIQLFHGSSKGPAWPGVHPQIECLSPSWDDMIRHTVDECTRLGLRFSMQNCPGWAMSGGPWITPENAMRHLVWSRTVIHDGDNAAVSLPLPEPSKKAESDYRDVAVIAFPTPEGEDSPLPAPSKVRGSSDKHRWADVLAGKMGAEVMLAGEMKSPAWVEVTFDHEVTLRSIQLPSVEKLAMRRFFDPGTKILVQSLGPDGLVDVVRREIPRGNWQDDRPLTLALPDTTAKTFRFTFENRYPIEISQLSLSSSARVDNWEGQAGFVLRSLDRGFLPDQMRTAWVNADKILDLTEHLDPTGQLQWKAPTGNWTVLRFGHVNTGQKNHPAPPEATGFECDKLSAAGAEAHFAGYIGRISAPGGPADGGRLKGMVIDSWECRTQTWTPTMEKEFAGRRSYALRKWLPALAGWVVGDHLTSQRFLRDWRATLNDLLVSNYYGRLASLGRERGMTLSFEAGPGDVAIGDILQYYGKADIPMCEFWWPNDPHWGGLENKPTTPAVSAAHIYGKPLIAAEAFTNIKVRWDEHPFMLKHLADRHFSMGVNHLVLHTYTHNPRLDIVPGTTFGSSIGTPFLRGQTWWPQMPVFTEYLARCGSMLQHGQPVADVLWYLGDDLDHKPMQNHAFPPGYQFDYLNQDALLHRITAKNGLLTTPEGVTWKILWLPDQTRLTAESLVRLRELIRQGATIVGQPSFQNPSLSGGLKNDAVFNTLIHELWGNPLSGNGDRKMGSGRLLWGMELNDALTNLGFVPDVIGANSATWCHRQIDETDTYFIAAHRETPLRANLSFRAQGRPELWDPLTGTTKPINVFERVGEHTTIPIHLPAAGSAFVIFRPGNNKPAFTRIDFDQASLVDASDPQRVDEGRPQASSGLEWGETVQPWVEQAIPAAEITDDGNHLLAWKSGIYELFRDSGRTIQVAVTHPRPIPLNESWTLKFPADWGLHESLKLPTLQAWSELDPPAARAFSGTATYSHTVHLDGITPDARWMLDLGRVDVIAEVKVNGSPAGVLWAPPFRLDITRFVSPGENRIEVNVTSTWFNRLAHDASQPEALRKTWTISGPNPKSPRQPAGLTGPVILYQGQVLPITNDYH